MTDSHPVSDTAHRVALITGGSRGLGHALASVLLRRDWRVITDARNASQLAAAVARLPHADAVTAVAGDVTDTVHRQELAAAVRRAGGLDLLVNNASVLGPSPQPPLSRYPLAVLEHVYAVNVLAPLALFQLLLPDLERRRGVVINITSDAAVEPYQGWGGYGSSKAALDQLTAILAAEHPTLRIHAFDPGDMNTQLHQQAFPGEDISDRAAPEQVVPALLQLIDGDLPSGRHRAAQLQAAVPA